MVEHVLSADTAVPDQMHQIIINNKRKQISLHWYRLDRII